MYACMHVCRKCRNLLLFHRKIMLEYVVDLLCIFRYEPRVYMLDGRHYLRLFNPHSGYPTEVMCSLCCGCCRTYLSWSTLEIMVWSLTYTPFIVSVISRLTCRRIPAISVNTCFFASRGAPTPENTKQHIHTHEIHIHVCAHANVCTHMHMHMHAAGIWAHLFLIYYKRNVVYKNVCPRTWCAA